MAVGFCRNDVILLNKRNSQNYLLGYRTLLKVGGEMKTSKQLMENFNYLTDPMAVGKYGERFASLEAFVAAMGANMELDFVFNHIRWYLGPAKCGYILSKDDGQWTHPFNSIDEILNYDFNGLNIRQNWSEIFINEL